MGLTDDLVVASDCDVASDPRTGGGTRRTAWIKRLEDVRAATEDGRVAPGQIVHIANFGTASGAHSRLKSLQEAGVTDGYEFKTTTHKLGDGPRRTSALWVKWVGYPEEEE
jgi:hypothetical protein